MFKDWFEYIAEDRKYILTSSGKFEECYKCEGYIEEGSKFNTLFNGSKYLCEDCVRKRDNV